MILHPEADGERMAFVEGCVLDRILGQFRQA